MHVDDFIDYGSEVGKSDPKEAYARFFFLLHRQSATFRSECRDQIAPFKLYCDYGGERYRVTGASRLGDVWLAANFDRDQGYDRRVSVLECGNWGPQP